jgi:hypothetical protein
MNVNAQRAKLVIQYKFEKHDPVSDFGTWYKWARCAFHANVITWDKLQACHRLRSVALQDQQNYARAIKRPKCNVACDSCGFCKCGCGEFIKEGTFNPERETNRLRTLPVGDNTISCSFRLRGDEIAFLETLPGDNLTEQLRGLLTFTVGISRLKKKEHSIFE